MADKTKIEWADATLNYVNGCSLESPGCTNCYAMKQAHRFPVRQGLTVKTKGGMVWTGEVRENPKALEQALAWKRGRAIFWNAHGDLFHPSVPNAWIDRQFAVMALTPQHRHMVLTKRSARMREYLAAAGWSERVSDMVCAWPTSQILAGNEYLADLQLLSGQPLPNVWLGVSVEDQKRADERIPDLLATPAAVRFISAEPLLGAVDLRYSVYHTPGATWPSKLDWVIAGGESGPGARPMHPDWARSLRDQCAAAGVAFHFKQWGAYLPAGQLHAVTGKAWVGPHPLHTTKKYAGRQLDGVEHNGVPAHG